MGLGRRRPDRAVGAAGRPGRAAVVARGDLVMPGLVSAHQHAVDLLVAGGPTGPTFLDWLLGTYHSGLALAGPDDCALAVAAVRAATLAAGVTTMVDCWSVGPVADAARAEACADASIEAHRASGGRTVFGVMGNEHPAAGWATRRRRRSTSADLCRDADSTLAEVERLAAHPPPGRRRPHPRDARRPSCRRPRPHGAWPTPSPSPTRLGTVMPMHLCASPPSRAAYGPAELERDGLADPRLLAAHLSRDRRRRRGGARRGPGSAWPTAPARPRPSARALSPRSAALRRAGARCGIGLDNASLNPSRDLFAEARAAASASPSWPAIRSTPRRCSGC